MRVRPTHTSKVRWLGDFGAARSGDDVEPPPTSTPPSGVTRLQIMQATATPDGLKIDVEWWAPLARSATDWVGIYYPNTPNSPSIVWKYVPKGGTHGGMEFMLPLGGTYEARYFTNDSYTKVASDGPITGPGSVNTGDLDIPPPPIPGGSPRQALEAANAVVAVAVGPMPADPAALDQWSQDLDAARAAYPAVDEAVRYIERWSPKRSPRHGGIFDLVKAIGNAVVSGVKFIGNAVIRGVNVVGGAVGSVIKFIGGGRFPTPADYEPENLCITAWTDTPKFALLSALAAVVFPPALLYIGVYVPPNITGLTLGLAEAYTKGGTDRVIDKILNPLYESVSELAETLLDYALHGQAALVRWAIQKIADHLPDSILKGILLALSNAADAIAEAIKDIAKLKDEAFYVAIGDAITKAGAQFFSGNQTLKQTLEWMGAAIKGGGIAIATLIDKGIEGVQEAFSKLVQKVLGLPQDFDNLSDKVKAEIANAKTTIMEGGQSALDMLHVLVYNLREGVGALADALRKLNPFKIKIGDFLGGIMDGLGFLLEKVEAFINMLLDLVRRWKEGAFNPPAEQGKPPATSNTPPQQETQQDTGSALWLALGGGIAGALFAGPVGGVLGAGAGAFLGKGK